MKPNFTHQTPNSCIYAADSLAPGSTRQLTVLCEATPLGLWQCSCVQRQIGATGAEGPSAKHIPALRLLLFGQLVEHLAQIRQTKINLVRREKVHLKLFWGATAFLFLTAAHFKYRVSAGFNKPNFRPFKTF